MRFFFALIIKTFTKYISPQFKYDFFLKVSSLFKGENYLTPSALLSNFTYLKYKMGNQSTYFLYANRTI